MTGEVLHALNPLSDSVMIDATFGRGGHTKALLNCLGPKGQVYAIDRDPSACAIAEKWANSEPRLKAINATFSNLVEVAKSAGVLGGVSGILIDLGVSSPQLDDPSRGFSFKNDGPLDMRMDQTSGLSAKELLADISEADLINILKNFGEERFAARIAREIIKQRECKALDSTYDLAKIISECVPFYEKGKHPATRAFQAVRIYINQELEQLDEALPQAIEVLKSGGRLVVISFHSLEDRKVKNFFREAAKGDPFPPELPVTQDYLRPTISYVSKLKRPSVTEVNCNPRSRSAILRWAEKA